MKHQNLSKINIKSNFWSCEKIMLKKLDLYVYLLQRWVLIEETLIKLNICFFIKDDELLEKYNEIGEKVENSTKKEFDSEAVCNEISKNI